MKRIFICTFAVAIALAIPAYADIVNGGFEDGTTTGWTASGQYGITSVGTDPLTNGALATAANGAHSARVGDAYAPLVDGFYGNSSITQQWTKSEIFDALYFNWAAVALVPGADAVAHSLVNTPWFQIKVEDLTTAQTLFSEEYYSGSVQFGITPGWLPGSTNTSGYSNDPGIWYYRPWDTFELDLATIADGDLLKITLTTRDCTLGGHASYAYLDGFGNEPEPLPGVPEPSTLILLGLGLVGLAGLRKKL